MLPACHTLPASLSPAQTDWYRYNLKRSLRGQPPVGEDEFEALVESGSEAGRFSALMGHLLGPHPRAPSRIDDATRRALSRAAGAKTIK